jgi:hypothetical protein
VRLTGQTRATRSKPDTKRSFINARIREAIEFCGAHSFYLPPWAYWPADRWGQVGPEAEQIRRCGLGWDVTDFGSDDYDRRGLLLFTIRNGTPGDTGAGGKTYCEKLLLVGEDQETPYHFHWGKMEDIINRGGGRLVLELWNARRNTEELDETGEVSFTADGIRRTVPAGGKVVLQPGESITLPPYLYHRFYGEAGGGMVLGGEVSKVNDDARDNRFLEQLPRFSEIEEDEPAAFLLCNEYPRTMGG